MKRIALVGYHTYHMTVHREHGGLWTEVDELPGCFASGDTLPELKEAVIEAIRLYTAPSERMEM